MSTDAHGLVVGREVVKKYNGLTAVDGIDFTVPQGAFYGFLGPNGAGKTTTIRMIQCYSPITSGEIRVNGRVVGRDDSAIKARIGVAPQMDNLDSDLTVIKNLEIYANFFNIPKKTAIARGTELLEYFHLEEKMNSTINSLSGGMRRRLIIARALMNEPELLILDEPTTGLDPQARHVIWQKLRDLKDQGSTIILTTHYMEEAERLCDTVAIMDMGKILLLGEPEKLIEEHVSHDVVEARPYHDKADAVVDILEGDGLRYEQAGNSFFIFTDQPDSVVNKLKNMGEEAPESRRANLEDLFLKTTGRALREGA